MSETAEKTTCRLEPKSPSSGERWALSLISCGHFLSHFYGLALPPLFPLLKTVFGVTYIELGLAMTAYGILGGIIQAPVGFLVDRFGPSRVLLAGTVIISTSVLLMGFVDSYWILILLSVFAGIGNSVFHPADYAILAGSINNKRLGRAYSLHTFSGFLGGACAPVTMLGLASIWDWRIALIIMGGIGLIISAMMALKRGVLLGEDSGKETIERKRKPATGLTLLLTPPVLLFFAFFILYGVASGGLIAFTVSGLINLHSIGLDTANTVLTAHLFGVVGGILLAGIIVDRYPRHIITGGIALIIAAVSTLLPSIGVSSNVALILAMTMSGIGLGSVLPPRDLMLKAFIPTGQTGKVFGFVFVGYSIGHSIAPPVLGSYLDAGEPSMVFITCAAFAALSFAAIVAANIATSKIR